MTPTDSANYQKILLILLPFHPPLIPPLGIACLKSYLTPHGFEVKTINANTDDELKMFSYRYFKTLGKAIPKENQANFHNIGGELLRLHMMAYFYQTDQKEYDAAVESFIRKTFYCDFDDKLIRQLNDIIEEYYDQLEEYFLEVLEREKPGVLGISVFKGSLPSSLFAFKLAKETYPELMTVMGGGVFADQLASGSPDLDVFVEQTPYIDKYILGEGEQLFLKLLQNKLPADQRVFSIKDTDPPVVNFSSVQPPDFGDFDVGYYPYLANYTSRSCPYQCTFCGETVLWGKYRKKDKEQITREMGELYRRHDHQLILICDSLLNPTIDKIAEGFMEHDLPVYWDGYLRLDKPVCQYENTLRWRRGGFYRARLGVESGSQRILDLMDKKITTEQIKSAVASLANAGIKTTTYWIAGYPGETEADFQQTLDLIEEMKDNIYEAEANPFWYYLNALIKSDEWSRHSVSLYPEAVNPMLLFPTRVLNIEPSPEERYRRLVRFTRHCERLGIPNPYSMADIFQADKRWTALHKNAVPPVNDFLTRGKIDRASEVPPDGA